MPLRNQGLAHPPKEKSAPCFMFWLVHLFLQPPLAKQTLNQNILHDAKHSEDTGQTLDLRNIEASNLLV